MRGHVISSLNGVVLIPRTESHVVPAARFPTVCYSPLGKANKRILAVTVTKVDPKSGKSI